MYWLVTPSHRSRVNVNVPGESGILQPWNRTQSAAHGGMGRYEESTHHCLLSLYSILVSFFSEAFVVMGRIKVRIAVFEILSDATSF